MKTSDKHLFLILCFSAFIHGLIIFAFNFKYTNDKIFNLNENRVEINLENIEESESSDSVDIKDLNIKPETSQSINYSSEKINEVKLDIPVKVKKITKNIDIHQINEDYSSLAKISSDIPLVYPSAIKKGKADKKIGSLGKKIKNGNKGDGRNKNINTESIISSYLGKIRIIIERHKRYPIIAKRRGIEGKVFLQFELLNNGRVDKIKIIKSSGSKILDFAAKKAILESTPFPKFPREVKLRKIEVKLTILFKLN